MPKTIALVLACALIATSGCSGDDDKTKKDSGPGGEVCLSPGLTSNDCVCDTGIRGSRTCGQNEIWGACSCPSPLPPGVQCRAGQRLLCPTCPGMTGDYLTRCKEDGTYDCSCPGDDASVGAAGSGSGDAAVSGSDAAVSGNDAGH